MKNTEKILKKLHIRVDYRTELLGIIQIISDYKKEYPHLLEKRSNKGYIEKIEKTFQKYKSHQAIQLFNDLIKHNFSYDAPVALFLQLDENFKCQNLPAYPFEERLNKDPKTYSLIASLSSFIKESSFKEFYNQNKPLHQKMINNICNKLENNNMLQFMFDYYGVSDEKKFIVNLIPWQSNGNYGHNNDNEVFANICCPKMGIRNSENIYQFDRFELLHLLFHEFSHSIINPLTDKYYLENDEDFFADIKEKMVELAYGRAKTIINEHFIRALTLRYHWHTNQNQSDYNQLIVHEKNRGFIHIENVLESLITYENNRDIYPTIEGFYPRLLDNMMQKSFKK